MINPIFTITKKSTTDNIDGYSEFVQDIMWTACCTDGEYTAFQNGGTALALIPSKEFIRFQELTDEQCLVWVLQSLSTEGMKHVQDTLTAKLLALKVADAPRVLLQELTTRLTALENK